MLHRILAAALVAAMPAGLLSCSDSDDDDPTSAELTNQAVANLNQQTSAGLAKARQQLAEAVAKNPENDLARFLLGAVRLAALVDDNDPSSDSTLAELLEGYGVDLHNASIFDFIDGSAPPPDVTEPLPNDSPTAGEVQEEFLLGDLLDAVRKSIDDWEKVDADFSQVVNNLFGAPVELDYGDAQLAAGAARLLEAQLLLAGVLDLDADVDVLVNTDANPMTPEQEPFRLFNGDSPMAIVAGKLSDTGRMGFLNEQPLTGSVDTFLPTPEADQRLDEARLTLLAAIQRLDTGMKYVEDPDTSDDLLVVTAEGQCMYLLAEPWFVDLTNALSGGDPVVDPLDAMNATCEVHLAGATVMNGLVFGGATYDGRLFLPDYTTTGTTTADATSFDHAVNDPMLSMLHSDLTGKVLDGQAMLDAWNALNAAWDTLFAGDPLEPAY